jgi:hypothetical protein
MARFIQLAITVLVLVSGNYAFSPLIQTSKNSFTRLNIALDRGVSLTPRPPTEPPIDIENNPAVSFTPQPPQDPPTDIANNPAVVIVTMEDTKKSKTPLVVATPGYFYFTEEVSSAIKIKSPEEISVEQNSLEEIYHEEHQIVSQNKEPVAIESPADAKVESQNNTKEEYNDLGVLAESIGKVAFGGSKAAILGIKAFVDTMSSS